MIQATINCLRFCTVNNDAPLNAFIFGATDLAQLLYSNLKSLGRDHVAAFVVDRRFRKTETLLGLPVLDAETLPMRFSPAEYACYVCIGYSHMNDYRAEAYAGLRGMGYSFLNFFHPTAQINCESQGVGNLVFQHVVIDYFTTIGDGNVFYPNVLVAHHTTIGNYNFFSVSCCVTGHVVVTDACFIGANATVGNNITLENHSLIGAGAYAASSVKPYGVVVPQRSMMLKNKRSTDFL